jgi:acyl carrier protein
MDKKKLETEILEIIKDVTMEEDISNIDHSTPFKDQLDIDSMDFLDIVMQVKEKYGIDVPAEDFTHFVTMNQLCSYLKSRITKQVA